MLQIFRRDLPLPVFYSSKKLWKGAGGAQFGGKIKKSATICAGSFSGAM